MKPGGFERPLLGADVEIERLKRQRLPAVEELERLQDRLVKRYAANILVELPGVLDAPALDCRRCVVDRFHFGDDPLDDTRLELRIDD